MIRILVLLIILGLVWWLITFLPLVEPFITMIHIVIILCLIWEVIALGGRTPSVFDVWKTPPTL